MARTLGLFIDFEESGAEARRRFLWNLVDTEGEGREEDDPRGPEDFEDIETLVLHAESRMKSGACNLNLPGVWDMGVAVLDSGRLNEREDFLNKKRKTLI